MSKSRARFGPYDETVGARRKKKAAGLSPLGAYVRTIRTLLGAEKYGADQADRYTQTEFGEDLDIGQTHVARIERGDRLPSPDTLEKLRRATVRAGREPMGLIYAWLEQQELFSFVEDIKREKLK